MRAPSVRYVVTETAGNLLILNLPARDDTQIIFLDPVRGTPSFGGQAGQDIFPSINKAMQYVNDRFKAVSHFDAYMIGGMLFIGNAAVICLITSVSVVGKIFKEHDVFCVGDVKYITVNNYELTPNEKRHLTQIQSFPLKNNHFICHSLDLSNPLNCKPTTSYIWNTQIAKPFEFFPLGKVCPDIIQGYFASIAYENMELHYIMRLCSETSGPLYYQRGTNSSGGLGQMATVELMMAIPDGEGYDVQSGVILRGTTPICFKSGKTAPDSLPYVNIPVFIHRMTDHLGIPRLIFYDLNHSGCDRESEIETALRESVSFVKENFNVEIVQKDWECMRRQTNLVTATDTVLHSLKLLAHETTHGVFARGRLRFDRCQDAAIVVTSLNGLDRANLGAFFVARRIVGLMVEGAKAFAADELERTLVGFLGACAIRAGDIIAQMAVGTESISHNDILDFIGRRGRRQNASKIGVVRVANSSYDVAAKNAVFSLFRAPQRIIPKPVPQTIRCVSRAPGAFVVSPASAQQLFTAKVPCVLQNDGVPIIIRLSEPVYVTEIEITLPASTMRLPPASRVTVWGGPYANRLFPVIEDMALPSCETERVFRFSPAAEKHYCHEARPNRHCHVRYLTFCFEGPLERLTVTHINVFGTTHGPDPHQIPPMMTLPPLTESADFSDALSSEIALQWEERRLCALMPLRDYMFEVAPKTQNPGCLLADDVFTLGPSEVSADSGARCDTCGKAATFKCGLCRRYFCNRCSKMNDSHDQQTDPKNIKKLCNECSERRFKMTASITRMMALNTRATLAEYPFLESDDGRFAPVEHSIECAAVAARTADATRDVEIGASLEMQAPIGDDGVIVEDILCGLAKTWRPRENMVGLEIVFQQYAAVNAVDVRVDSRINIEVIGDRVTTTRTVEPPGLVVPVEAHGRGISVRLFGGRIELRGLRFLGRPIEAPPVPVSSAWHSLTLPEDFRYVRVKLRNNETMRQQTLQPAAVRICGLEILEARGIRSMIIAVIDEEDTHYERFVFPRADGPARIFFSRQFVASGIIVYYTEVSHSKFVLPTVRPIGLPNGC